MPSNNLKHHCNKPSSSSFHLRYHRKYKTSNNTTKINEGEMQKNFFNTLKDFSGGFVDEATNFINTKLNKISENATSTTFALSTRSLAEADYAKLQNAIKVNASTTAEIKEFAMTGPSISSEIVKKSVIGFILVVLAIILFIWFSFRGGSGSVSSWKYGVIAIVALVHDITIPAGVFSYLGATQGVEIDALFVVALLTILGISISDTIVIFDRIRENIKGTGKNANFEEVVGKSLDQSMVRSLATSVSVIVVLLALVFYGPESTKYFSIALTIGMFVGTYSSIFVASPLLVLVSKYWKTKN
jgi:preprotein translocase subunit SecF